MSDSRYSYDDSTEVWPYFAITLVGAVVVPVTLSRLLSSRKRPVAPPAGPKVYNSDQQVAFKKSKNVQSFVSTSTLLLVLGWAIIGVLVYIIYACESDAPEVSIYDPFEILGIASNAAEKEVKSAYRKLSLQFHPDKFKETVEMTTEMAESIYIDLTKAYKALTDEVTRENFLKYGHPDGPQQSSHGIALPGWLVGSASPLVIAGYAIVIGGVLPYAVGKWWARQKAHTRSGLRIETATTFFELAAKEQAHFITFDVLLEYLTAARELQLAAPGRSQKEIRELIDAHFNRVVVPNESEKLAVVAEAGRLLSGLLEIVAEFKHGIVVQRVIELQRCIVQAVPPTLQTNGRFIQIPGAKLTAKSLADVPKEGLALERQYVPKLNVVRARFTVMGETVLAPGSLPMLEIDYVIGPIDEPAPSIDLDELDALAPDVLDIDPRNLQNPMRVNTLPPALPDALAPFYPDEFVAKWQVLLVGERDNKLLHPPVPLANADLSNLALTPEQRAAGDGVVAGVFKIQLTAAAPTFAGEFAFKVAARNTGYFGVDAAARAVMKVVPESQLPQAPAPEVDSDSEEEKNESEEEEEDDLSDIDTDTEDEQETEK